MKDIVVRGARQHNLKNINLTLPRDKFIVVTGLSGSGKSTLAFDTIYAEGQRRYVESLSAYARQFIGVMGKPDVDSIEGLSPAISIEQKAASSNPRSTVGTVTEIYDYLRLLFARIGRPQCSTHGVPIESQSPQRIAQRVASDFSGTVSILAPIVRQKKGTYAKLFEDLNKDGYARARVNGEIHRTDEKFTLARYEKQDIDVVIDRVEVKDSSRLAEAVQNALKKADGLVIASTDKKEILYSSKLSCPLCGESFEELQPRMFSFNSPFGACEECHGLGVKMWFDPDLIIPDTSKSIADGAIALYRNMVDGWRAHYLSAVAKHYDYTVLTPIKDLTRKQYDALMYGSPDTLRFKMENADSSWSHSGTWEGLIPQSDRLYRETESEYRRTELEKFMRVSPCPSCKGKRLKPKILAVKINGKSIADVSDFSISDALAFFNSLSLTEKEKEISKQILKEVRERLQFLDRVGLAYLTLSRASGSLSGGESQRIRLATQIGANLMGVLYVLDEPSIGLHQRDNHKLIETLRNLRDLGNTLLVVEHDEDTIRSADFVVDMGPGAGANGGKIIATGTPAEIESNSDSLTGAYLSGRMKIDTPPSRRKPAGSLQLLGCRENNLKNFDVSIPLGVLTLVTGVSGSGKSSLVYEILYPALMNHVNGSHLPTGRHDGLTATAAIDKVIVIDQSPIGRTPRSNPATYTKLFDEIRFIFSLVPEAKARGYGPGRFSFNVEGGRCEACSGDGVKKIEMQFLPDVYVECEECRGKRYNTETLEIRYRGKTIADVLDMTVDEAFEVFQNVPSIRIKLDTLKRVGLGYVKLGQSSTTLSGGEAQRIKITRELAKRATGRTVYLLDEPTTGLHFHDVKNLIKVLSDLVELGNSVIVIEHNLDVVKSADWIIDLGPEGGDGGGEIVASGTPEDVARNKKSYTGEWLKKVL